MWYDYSPGHLLIDYGCSSFSPTPSSTPTSSQQNDSNLLYVYILVPVGLLTFSVIFVVVIAVVVICNVQKRKKEMDISSQQWVGYIPCLLFFSIHASFPSMCSDVAIPRKHVVKGTYQLQLCTTTDDSFALYRKNTSGERYNTLTSSKTWKWHLWPQDKSLHLKIVL